MGFMLAPMLAGALFPKLIISLKMKPHLGK